MITELLPYFLAVALLVVSTFFLYVYFKRFFEGSGVVHDRLIVIFLLLYAFSIVYSFNGVEYIATVVRVAILLILLVSLHHIVRGQP